MPLWDILGWPDLGPGHRNGRKIHLCPVEMFFAPHYLDPCLLLHKVCPKTEKSTRWHSPVLQDGAGR